MLNRSMNWSARFLVVLGLALIFTGCGSENPEVVPASVGGSDSTPISSDTNPTPTNVPVVTDESATSVAPPAPQPPADREIIFKTNHGDVTVRLFSSKAPATVENFVDGYVRRGHFANTLFHYVDNGFMIMGGGYDTNYQPKATRAVIVNEANNGLKNKRGTIAMAREPEYVNSGTCQFFINLSDNASLDHQNTEDAAGYGYCVFGKVISGMEVVDKIALVAVADAEKTVSFTTQVTADNGKVEDRVEQQQQQFTKTPVQPVIIQSVQLVK